MMATDPLDAFLANGPAQGAPLADPLDAFLGADAPGPAVSKWESAGRGGLAGLSMDLDDELGGWMKSIIGEGTYAEYRDELRRKKAAAQEANPWTYGGASLAGGLATAFVPGLGAAKGVQTVGQAVRTGAAMGALGGLGASDADLTKGDVLGAARDTAIGGAIGGALGGVLNKVIGGAPKRVVGDLQEEVITGARGVRARPKYQQQLANVAEQRGERVAETPAQKVLAELSRDADDTDILTVLRKNPAIRKAMSTTEKARGAIESRLGELRKVNPAEYEAVDKAVGEPAVASILAPLRSRLDEVAREPGNTLLKNELRATLADATESWAGRDTIPLTDVRKWVTNIQAKASNTLGSIDQTTRAPIMAEVSGLVKQSIDDHLADAVTQRPELAQAVRKILDTNREMSILLSVDKALGNRAIKEASKGASLTERFKSLANMGGAMATVSRAMAGDFMPLAVQVGANVAAPAAKKATRWLDFQAASLARGAMDGSLTANAVKRALETGVPTATVRASLRFVSDADKRALLEEVLSLFESNEPSDR